MKFQIVKNSCVELEIKKSKFIAFSYIVNSSSEAKDYLNALQIKYSDSTHICFAYFINGEERFSDDGEPSGTAGCPILNCLKKQNLNCTLIAIVRYFGGVKLGAGGLVRAYSKCASSVLIESGKCEQVKRSLVLFSLTHSEYAKISHLLNKYEHKCVFTDEITISIFLSEEELDLFIKDINFKLNRAVSYTFQN